ncbi:hypothetical protein [Acinetobacter guillouiae]|uniref:hypothetical protein n=1 Tax=Acinetobacter guillouiae TaxID=106649 RepID=UPI0028EA6705|nr:hypothetical protein [Acinetobacter guillouiae]
MIDFISDVEWQYEKYCDIAEEYGFLDRNSAKAGFRCTTKSNEFNAGWIAFAGAVSALRNEFHKLRNENEALKKQLEEKEEG